MSYSYQPTQSYNPNPQNLQFYPSSYNAPVSGHTTPSQAQYGNTYGSSPHTSSAYGAGSSGAYGSGGFGAGGGPGFGAQAGISGRMGEQGGLRMGWLAAFGTEGYDGEPPLLEELGVNFEHIKMKVRYNPPGRHPKEHFQLTLHPTKFLDPHGPQPPRPHRPTHNGRLRPRRPHPLLPPLRHLLALQRKSPLRLHLRPGSSRIHLPTLGFRAHVSTAGTP